MVVVVDQVVVTDMPEDESLTNKQQLSVPCIQQQQKQHEQINFGQVHTLPECRITKKNYKLQPPMPTNQPTFLPSFSLLSLFLSFSTIFLIHFNKTNIRCNSDAFSTE